MIKDEVCVIGIGGHGKVIVRLLQELGYTVAGIFDDDPRMVGLEFFGVPVLGPVDGIGEHGFTQGVIAVGNNAVRKSLAERIDLSWPTLIHPTAFVDATAVLGKGTVVLAKAVVNVDSYVGDHAILNTGSSIDHDCHIENYVHLAPGSILAGNATVRQGGLIGTGASVIPGVTIGSWATVGAGATVIDAIEDESVAVGVPARGIRRRNTERFDSTNLNSERIYLSPPHMSGNERQMLLAAFDSNWIAPLGPQVDAFEREIADKAGVEHAVALSSGTAALHLSLKILGVEPGDEVITSSLTFAAPANAIKYMGATPVFIDSEPESWNMDPELLASEIKESARRGRLPKAVIAVDIFGQCADYARIHKICASYEIPLIEDAAESLGATYRNRPAGSFGDMGCFSFNGNKIITTSCGGMLVTNREDWALRARHLASQAKDPAPHYQHSEVGYNYRMSNLLAAIGRGQLQLLEDRVARRRANFEFYQEHLGDLPGISFMPELPLSRSNRWLTCILIEPEEFGASSEDIRTALADQNIESRPLWKPMHLQPVFKQYRMRGGFVSRRLFERGLCLPSGSNLTESDLNRIVDIVRHLARDQYVADTA